MGWNKFDPIQPYFVLGSDFYFKKFGSFDAVAHFYRFDCNSVTGGCGVVPDGSIDIIFECGRDNPSAIVAGSVEVACDSVFRENCTYFGVRLMPGVSDRVAGISARELVGTRADLEDVTGRPDLIENICLCSTFEEQIEAFRQSFIALVGTVPEKTPPPIVCEILHKIFLSDGNIHIFELERGMNYSRRHLSRVFQNYTGMDIKRFCTIIRFQTVLSKINHGVYDSIALAAHDNGYYDQNHFQKDFRRFASMTPKAYQRLINESDYVKRISIL